MYVRRDLFCHYVSLTIWPDPNPDPNLDTNPEPYSNPITLQMPTLFPNLYNPNSCGNWRDFYKVYQKTFAFIITQTPSFQYMSIINCMNQYS